jgi:hypothetical protein
MADDEPFEVVDSTGLTDADWTEINNSAASMNPLLLQAKAAGTCERIVHRASPC